MRQTLSERVHLVDCTLREGDQTAGVAMTGEEKLTIACMLDTAGVALADAGMPEVSEDERGFLRAAVDACSRMQIGASVRCRTDAVRMALDCGVDAVFIICPISRRHLMGRLGIERDALLDQLEACADLVRGQATIEVVAEDATRAEDHDLSALITRAIAIGAARVYISDTVGVRPPGRWLELVRRVLDQAGDQVEVGVHCHNDYGLATANTLSAIEAGVRWPTACVNGLGERAGNADLGSVAAGVAHLLGGHTGLDLRALPALSHAVERAAGMLVPDQHPLVGANAFRHESGIHVDGVLRDPQNYEALEPETVGRDRTLLIGKHSGRSHLRTVLESAGCPLDDDGLQALRSRIQQETSMRDRAAFDALLKTIESFRSTTQGVHLDQVIAWAKEIAK